MAGEKEGHEQPIECIGLVKPRPWVRFWARMFDFYLYFNLLAMILAVDPAFIEPLSNALLGFICIFAWVFVEAFLLAVSGTTPGKSLLRVKIAKADGSSLGLKETFLRSFSVWFRGLGIGGIPVVVLFTMMFAYNKLKTDGITSWDKDGGFTISHVKIGWRRIVVITLLFCVFPGLILLGQAFLPSLEGT